MNLINKISLFLSMIALSIATLSGSYNVVSRMLDYHLKTNISSNSFNEIQWYSFSIIFLLMGGYLVSEDRHIRVDFFYSKLSDRNKNKINIIGYLLFILPFCLIMIYVSSEYFYRSFCIGEVSPDPNGLCRYFIKAFIPTSFVLILINASFDFIKRIKY